jgi:8-oxo-dGTP pyrophosphatase MutT (NUDIX family)
MRRPPHTDTEVCDALDPKRLAAVLSARRIGLLSSIVAPRRSAVAAILRRRESGPEVLLMQRVERPTDRWSGQISFPGGMAQQDDPDALATAVRETVEEVGLDLNAVATRLGRLDDQVAIARGKRLPMAIAPFVFWMQDDAELTFGPEAQSAFWMPIGPAVNGDYDGIKEWKMAGMTKKFPAWHVEGHIVWGLTHRMLTVLFEVAGLQPTSLQSLFGL